MRDELDGTEIAPIEARRRYERAIAETTSSRRRKTLELIWNVLMDLQGAGQIDFSVATVGRRIEAAGGPRTQSLRNAGLRDAREIIEAFGARKSKQRSTAEANRATVDAEIARIPNLAVQVALRMAMSERERLKTENDMLRGAFKQLAINPSADVTNVPTPVASQALRMEAFPRIALDAVALFKSATWLEEHGLTVGDDGSLSCAWMDGALLAPPGLMLALEELLKMATLETYASED